jgi:uncharacterized membrane protein YtjA (UPF0391 family)
LLRGIAARAAGAAKAAFVVELFALSLLCAASGDAPDPVELVK